MPTSTDGFSMKMKRYTTTRATATAATPTATTFLVSALLLLLAMSTTLSTTTSSSLDSSSSFPMISFAAADDIMNWARWSNSFPQARVGAIPIITDHFLFIAGGIQRPISYPVVNFWKPSPNLLAVEEFTSHYKNASLLLNKKQQQKGYGDNELESTAGLSSSDLKFYRGILEDHFAVQEDDDMLLPTLLYFDLISAYKFFPLTTQGDVLLPILSKTGVAYHPGEQFVFVYACDINRDRLASNMVTIVTIQSDMESLGGETGGPQSVGSNAMSIAVQGPSNAYARKAATLCRYSNFINNPAQAVTHIHHTMLDFVKVENVSMFLIGGVDVNGNQVPHVETFFNMSWTTLINTTSSIPQESSAASTEEYLRQRRMSGAGVHGVQNLDFQGITVGEFTRPYCYCSCIQDPHFIGTGAVMYISDCVNCDTGDFVDEVVYFYPNLGAFEFYKPDPTTTTTTSTTTTTTTSTTTPSTTTTTTPTTTTPSTTTTTTTTASTTTTTAAPLFVNASTTATTIPVPAPDFNTQYYWLGHSYGVGSRYHIGQYFPSLTYNTSNTVAGSSMVMGIFDSFAQRQDLKETVEISIDRFDCTVFAVCGSVMCVGGTIQVAPSQITPRGDFCEMVPTMVALTDKSQYIIGPSHGFKSDEELLEHANSPQRIVYPSYSSSNKDEVQQVSAVSPVTEIDVTMSISTHRLCLDSTVFILTSDSACRNPLPFLSPYSCDVSTSTIVVSLTSVYLSEGEYQNMYICYTDGTCAVEPRDRVPCSPPDPGGDSCRWQRCCWDPDSQACFMPGRIDGDNSDVIATTPWRLASSAEQGKAPIMAMVTLYNPVKTIIADKVIWYKVPWVIACFVLSFLIVIYFVVSLYWRFKKRRMELQKTSKYVNSAFFEAFGKKYTVEGLIGEGGYGAVFLAERNKDHQQVALKIVPCQDSKQRDAALSEFDVLNKLKHPNVIEVLDLIISWDQNDSHQTIQTGIFPPSNTKGFTPNTSRIQSSFRGVGGGGGNGGGGVAGDRRSKRSGSGSAPKMYGSPSSRLIDAKQQASRTSSSNPSSSLPTDSRANFSPVRDSLSPHTAGGGRGSGDDVLVGGKKTSKFSGNINGSAGSDLRTPLIGGGGHNNNYYETNNNTATHLNILSSESTTGTFANVLNYQALQGEGGGSVTSSGGASQLPSRFICLVSDYYPEGDLTRFIIHYPRRGAVRVKREEAMGDPLKHVLGLRQGNTHYPLDGDDSDHDEQNHFVGAPLTDGGIYGSADLAEVANAKSSSVNPKEEDGFSGVAGVNPREFSRRSSVTSNGTTTEEKRGGGGGVRESRGAVVEIDNEDEVSFYAAAEACVNNCDAGNNPMANALIGGGGRAYHLQHGQQQKKTLPVPEIIVVSIALQIASALHFMHSQSRPVVHRDLKPDNVLVDGDRVVLTDFGLSSWAKSPLNDNKGAMVGTLFFAAPETFGIDCGILDDQEDDPQQQQAYPDASYPLQQQQSGSSIAGSFDEYGVGSGTGSTPSGSPPKRVQNSSISSNSNSNVVSFRPTGHRSSIGCENSSSNGGSGRASSRYIKTPNHNVFSNNSSSDYKNNNNNVNNNSASAASAPAPEILLDYNGHQLELAASPPVDMWGLGCILYAICSKRVTDSTARVMFSDIDEPDFESGLRAELANINVLCTLETAPISTHASSTVSSPVPGTKPQFNAVTTRATNNSNNSPPPTSKMSTGYSTTLQDIILNLLQKNPLRRYTAEEASEALAALYHRHEQQIKKCTSIANNNNNNSSNTKATAAPGRRGELKDAAVKEKQNEPRDREKADGSNPRRSDKVAKRRR